MIKIEKGIELPDPPTYRNATGRPVKYPFSDMEVGDSFLVACDGTEGAAKRLRSSVSAAARLWSRRYDESRRFSTRFVPGGVRVWRVE